MCNEAASVVLSAKQRAPPMLLPPCFRGTRLHFSSGSMSEWWIHLSQGLPCMLPLEPTWSRLPLSVNGSKVLSRVPGTCPAIGANCSGSLD